ncbi:MAG: J domain-containing protein [Desulfobacteraceae bacterium]|jgi:curved DNA-binding protein CbpA|nr:J domain-containing protein [Desulfobacteraceae bacterium]
MDPYEILGLTPEADDAAIRTAYLELVRRYPPDHHPQRFAAVSEAYQILKDEGARLRHQLFNLDSGLRSPIEVLQRRFAAPEARRPLTAEALQLFLRQRAMQ